MDTQVTKLIQEQFAKLPVDLQRAINSADLHKKITELGNKHHLHIDQMGQLEDEIVLLMLGLSDPKEFTKNLTGVLRIDTEQAKKIEDDVGQEIMSPIRNSWQKFMEQEEPQAKESLLSTIQTIPAKETSVVMPSAVHAATAPTPPKAPPTPTPPASVTPKPVATTATTPTQPLAAKPVEIHAADLMLSQPTVSMPKPPAPAPSVPKPSSPPAPATNTPAVAPAAKVEALKPEPYKADPYREPPE